MKKYLPILCLIVSLAFTVKINAAVKSPTESFYANDYANVLSGETINYIISEHDRISGTGAEIVVTTIDFTDGRDIGEYATDMFNSWGIGDSEKNNGVLLLLSIGDDDYRVATGKGIDRYMDAGTVQSILDAYLEEYFAAGDYDKGVRKTFDALCAQVEKLYPLTGSASGGYPIESGGFGAHSFESALFIILAIFIFIVIVAAFSGRRRAYYNPGPRIPWYYFGRRRRYHHHHHHHHGHMPPPPPPKRGGFGGGFNPGPGDGGARGGGGMSRGSGAGRSGGGFTSGGGAGRLSGSRPSGGFGGGGGGMRSGGGARGGGGVSRGSGAGRRK